MSENGKSQGGIEMHSKLGDYSSVFIEFYQYLYERKSFWLAPVIFSVLLLGSLAFFLEGSVVAPAIYSIF